MPGVEYIAWIEYSDGVMGCVELGFKSADEAEKVARGYLASEVTSGYIKQEHGGVKAIVICETKEVRRIEL